MRALGDGGGPVRPSFLLMLVGSSRQATKVPPLPRAPYTPGHCSVSDVSNGMGRFCWKRKINKVLQFFSISQLELNIGDIFVHARLSAATDLR